MKTEIIVSLISLVGTAVGSFAGVITSSKLTNFRLEQLEKKVDKHNQFAERIPVVEEQMKVANHRISDLEEKVG